MGGLGDLCGTGRHGQSMVGNVACEREVEDTAIALLTFGRGGYGVLSVTHAAREPQDTLDVFGTEGSGHGAVLNEGTVRVVRGGR